MIKILDIKNLCWFFLLLLAGCAHTSQLNRDRDQVRIDVGAPSLEVRKDEVGVFVVNHGIQIYQVSKPLLSVIDELIYRVGGSYTVLSDLSSIKISIYEEKDGKVFQKRFNSSNELITRIVALANEGLDKNSSPNKLVVSLRSDGPEFSLLDKKTGALVCYNVESVAVTANKGAMQDCQKMSFKKAFLQNTSSEEVLKSLNSLFPGEIGSGADNTRIVEYKAQNALIIRGQDRQIYDRIAKLLPALDADFSQVVVETKVFQYSDSIDKLVGTMLNGNGQINLSSPFALGISGQLPNISSTISTPSNRASILTQLALQDSDGLIRVLAEPRLILQSGREATVALNTDKYFVTPGVNVPGSVQPLSTGVIFVVTPTVLGDQRVRLTLKITQSEFATNSEPGVAAAINKNTIDTSVVVNDGELISLGGILTRKDSHQSSGMIGIREVPVLGALFGSESDTTVVSRVEFFIRPTINRSHEKIEETANDIHDANCKVEDRFGGSACSEKHGMKVKELK
jgi:type II secretory pathway component GspD/PulD (secretin)